MVIEWPSYDSIVFIALSTAMMSNIITIDNNDYLSEIDRCMGVREAYTVDEKMRELGHTQDSKSSHVSDHAGLKASIVKAIFNDLSPAKSPQIFPEASDDIFTVAAKASPTKKLFDLSLSEGDLTLTDEKTPMMKSCSQNMFFPAVAGENSSSSLQITKERTSRVMRRLTDARRDSALTQPNGRGPTAEQLSWLRACRTGDIKMCTKLMDSNPDILQYIPPYHLNYSGVHIATQGRHYDLLRLFRERGANFNAPTRAGYTPLHLAAQKQDQETVQLLIDEFGVDTTIRDLMGYTYEHYADWLDYPDYDHTGYPLIYRGERSRSSSRHPSIGSQESLSSSKNSFSRHGSIRETIRGLLHIPKGLRSRSPSLNQLVV
ncbi:hypothetical protein RB195_004806 [Necator americanus]|uniref:Ankyrin repeat protein n=1 Tax=Necator americanus TaxID=51031 RepID=A0ABR1BMV0_NECAM